MSVLFSEGVESSFRRKVLVSRLSNVQCDNEQWNSNSNRNSNSNSSTLKRRTSGLENENYNVVIIGRSLYIFFEKIKHTHSHV